jgi:transposase
LRQPNGTSTRGKTSTPPPDPEDPPRRRANKRNGHGTFANDRPPIISIISRDTGECRVWGCDHATTHTCDEVIAANVPVARTIRYTDAWQSDGGSHPSPATVRHGMRAWARDDEGDGRRAVHGHTCDGAGAALRTYLRAFRGVHTHDRHLYVATDEVMLNAKWATPHLI